MIAGIGIDIVEVSRMEKSLQREGFKSLVFSPEEQAYCDKQQKPAEHYAARFAAKEAFLKAAGVGLQAGLTLCDIEIVKDTLGKPMMALHRDFSSLAKKHHWDKIHVSLSHTATMATAYVIIER
jgi:holo-[acyl-carrier protein] synthase